MHMRDLIVRTSAVLLMTNLLVSGCTTTASTTASPPTSTASTKANRMQEIDAGVDTALSRLHGTVRGSRQLTDKAEGMLVFPSVIAAGLGIGGQYGEGALRVHGKTEKYYRLASASVGLQIGAQSKTIIILFMTRDALDRFRNSNGWMVGADASVAVLNVGADGNVATQPAVGPVVAFVMTNAGLMANLTLEGTKIMPLNP